jgi:membrane-bound metal-dependent hydrolase YbcI (DUF457 family)
MMGRAHSLSGCAIWLVASPVAAYTANNISWIPDFTLNPALYAIGAIVCTGMALLPDLDHGTASFARNSLPPVTTAISNVLNSFGHRTLTHSWLGVIMAMVALVLLTLLPGGILGAVYPWALILLATASAMAALYPKKSMTKGLRVLTRAAASAAFATLAVWVTLSMDTGWMWLFVATFLGLVTHILGDCITVQGVPWLFGIKTWSYTMSPAIFLALFVTAPIYVVWTVLPALAYVLIGVCLFLSLLMLRPFRAGDWQETMILTPIFLIVSGLCVFLVGYTHVTDGKASVAGFPIESTPGNTGEVKLGEVGLKSPKTIIGR